MWLSALLLSACAAPHGAQRVSAVEGNALAASEIDNVAPARVAEGDQSGSAALDAELLYDLLLGNIAIQLDQREAALAPLTRAARQSRHPAVAAQAIQLANALQDHRGVIELADLMASIDSDDSSTRYEQGTRRRFDHQLVIAQARFHLGEDDPALRMLLDLARLRVAVDNQLAAQQQSHQPVGLSQNDSSQDNSNAPMAMFASGRMAFQRGDPLTARAMLRKFLAQDQSDAQATVMRKDYARIYLAEIETRQNNVALAAALLRAVSSPGYYLEAQVILASRIATLHGVDAAIRHVGNIARRGHADTIRLILEQDSLYRHFQQFERAKTTLDAALAQFPQQPDLLYNRGMLAAQLNLLALLERDMRQLIALQPGNARAYNALGYTLAERTERLDEALELITVALKIQPRDPFILDSMGWVHFRLGDNQRAIDYLRQAWAQRKDAEIAAHLGEALWVAGEQREAEEIWAQGQARAPRNATLLNTIERFGIEKALCCPAESSRQHPQSAA